MVSGSEVEVFELWGCDGCVPTGPYMNTFGESDPTGKSTAAVEAPVWRREGGMVLFWVCVYMGVTANYAKQTTKTRYETSAISRGLALTASPIVQKQESISSFKKW